METAAACLPIPRLTIFIPTRAPLPPRAVASIAARPSWDGVADGCSDDTAALVAGWRARVECPVNHPRRKGGAGPNKTKVRD